MRALWILCIAEVPFLPPYDALRAAILTHVVANSLDTATCEFSRKKVGSHGTGLRYFNSPLGIALIAHDTVIVCDYDNSRLSVVQISDKNGWSSEWSEFVKTIENPAFMKKPLCVAAVDVSTSTIVVSCIDHKHIFAMRWTDEVITGPVVKFASPKGVAAIPNRSDVVLVGDTELHTISLVDIIVGVVLKVFIDAGVPYGMVAAGEDFLIYVDRGNERGNVRVLRWTDGTVLRKIETMVHHQKGLKSPRGICLVDDDTVAVMDCDNNCVVFLSWREGTFLRALRTPGTPFFCAMMGNQQTLVITSSNSDCLFLVEDVS